MESTSIRGNPVERAFGRSSSSRFRKSARPPAPRDRAYHLPADYSANALVGDLLEELYGKNPLPSRTGGRIAIFATSL